MKIHNFRITQQLVKLSSLTSEFESLRFRKYCPPAGWRPNVDVFRFSDRYHVMVELAGVDKNHINLKMEGQVLILQGERRATDLDQEGSRCEQVLAIEIECGPFDRRLEFPEPVDSDAVSARHRNGFLLIDLPLRKS